MNVEKCRLFALFASAVLVGQGCTMSGIAGRAQEKATVYNQLPPAVQQHLQQGDIEMGYTEDMVYIALGKPNRIETRAAASGPVQVWVYRNIALETKGGFRGMTYNPALNYAPGISQNPSHHEAVHTPKYATQTNNSINADTSDAAAQLPDLPMGTLYVFFHGGRVFKMNMDA